MQPGGNLYGLHSSNPVDTGVVYRGPYAMYGMSSDPMVGSRVGGGNVSGGVSGDDARPDNIVFDITDGMSAGGFGHPQCLNTGDPAMLPAVRS